ncbi:MAG: dicarboxylate/amino acid:cation symporter [Pseudomonadota bacterium]
MGSDDDSKKERGESSRKAGAREASHANRSFTLAVFGGALLGALLLLLDHPPGLDALMGLLKTLFLGALKLIIAPLIFFSLLAGLAQLGEAYRLRTLGAATALYYVLTTTIAVAIGLFVVSFVHPWESAPPLIDRASLPSAALIPETDGSIFGVLRGLLETMLTNPFTALAELNVLAIVANALLIGIAMVLVLPRDSAWPELVAQAASVTQRIATWAVLLMPLGVMAVTYELLGSADWHLLGQLLSFCGVVLLATAVHGLIVLPLISWFGAGVGPIELARGIARPFLVALTTSSSVATLPVSHAAVSDAFRVRESVRSFVLPLGATMNMDGTALFEGIAAVFLAHLFGVELGAAGTIIVFLVAMISSIGAPGIPSGSMAGMQVVLLAAGIPLEAIGILLLVERPLDTFRTAVNVQGDIVGTLVVQRTLRRRGQEEGAAARPAAGSPAQRQTQ